MDRDDLGKFLIGAVGLLSGIVSLGAAIAGVIGALGGFGIGAILISIIWLIINFG